MCLINCSDFSACVCVCPCVALCVSVCVCTGSPSRRCSVIFRDSMSSLPKATWGRDVCRVDEGWGE